MANRGSVTASCPQPEPQALALARLFSPLSRLLVSGGDERLSIERASGRNAYGCYPLPNSDVVALSSSTATTISEPAYLRTEKARDDLVRNALTSGLAAAFDQRLDGVRWELRTQLKLDPATQILFSSSGTDSQQQVLLLLRQVFGASTSCIVVGADQTGRGSLYTARGQHFGNRTAQGHVVSKGCAVGRNSGNAIGITLIGEDGAFRGEGETDALVLAAVDAEVKAGRNVVLEIMAASKLGWSAPSSACLDVIEARWPLQVQIVVDACQMRMPRSRLNAHLSRGHVVLLTGSKFFGGPPFSGASLWPHDLHTRISAIEAAPEGLSAYASREDVPVGWFRLRGVLPSSPNFGQWLRWEAALLEMQSYYALPAAWRHDALSRLATAIPAMISSVSGLELVAPYNRDAAMPATIFSFFLRSAERRLELRDATLLYRALLDEKVATLGDRVCQIGQPVDLPMGIVLRLAIGARSLVEAFSEDASLNQLLAKVRVVLCGIGERLGLVPWPPTSCRSAGDGVAAEAAAWGPAVTPPLP